MSRLSKKQLDNQIAKAKRRYESFHEAEPEKVEKIHVPALEDGSVWTLWGTLESLSYHPHKPSKRSDAVYEHEFGDYGTPLRFGKNKPLLLVSADGNQLLIVKGKSKFKVTDRGIVG